MECHYCQSPIIDHHTYNTECDFEVPSANLHARCKEDNNGQCIKEHDDRTNVTTYRCDDEALCDRGSALVNECGTVNIEEHHTAHICCCDDNL